MDITNIEHTRRLTRRAFSTLALGTLLVASVAFGDNTGAKKKGLQIARTADQRDSGYRDYAADIEMVLRNRHGQESRRRFHMDVLEVSGDGDKSLIVFDSPRDVRGTALLTHSHKKGPDDQWLFMPALRRVKRISSSNRSGPFVGSEFAYEDLTSQEVEKYTYKYIKDEEVAGQACFVVARYPAYEGSGYKRQIVWYDKAEYRPRVIKFFDRKNEHVKTLTFSGYKKYLGKYWRAGSLTMKNVQTKKETVLRQSNLRFRTGLHSSQFEPHSLKRAR